MRSWPGPVAGWVREPGDSLASGAGDVAAGLATVVDRASVTEFPSQLRGVGEARVRPLAQIGGEPVETMPCLSAPSLTRTSSGLVTATKPRSMLRKRPWRR